MKDLHHFIGKTLTWSSSGALWWLEYLISVDNESVATLQTKGILSYRTLFKSSYGILEYRHRRTFALYLPGKSGEIRDLSNGKLIATVKIKIPAIKFWAMKDAEIGRIAFTDNYTYKLFLNYSGGIRKLIFQDEMDNKFLQFERHKGVMLREASPSIHLHIYLLVGWEMNVFL